MSQYLPKKIPEIIEEIENNEVILPAIQRDFVWTEEKVCDLFDSLLKDYPIGTFLFWRIKGSKLKEEKIVCNKFITVYDERNGRFQRGLPVDINSNSMYTAVLDGQQRITALYLGIRGSYETKIPKRAKADPNAYEDRYLCININHKRSLQDTKDFFRFLMNSQIEQIPTAESRDFWVKVSKIYDAGSDSSISKILREIESQYFPSGWPLEEREIAEKNLEDLKNMLFMHENINYFTTKAKTLADVVDVFVKVNSGGENLKAADLMLSVGGEALPDKDIHVVMKDAVAELAEEVGSSSFFDTNNILTASLLFTEAEKISVQAKESYTPQRMTIILNNWENIMSALKYTIRFLKAAGINVCKIPKNSFLSVAYYFYRRPNVMKPGTEYSIKNMYVKDRVLIRQFILRSIFAGLFDYSSAVTLIAVRREIRKAIDDGYKYFPLNELMTNLGEKKLSIGKEIIDDKILTLAYGDPKIDPILRELKKDTSARVLEIDHIWAKTYFDSRKKFDKENPGKTEDEYRSYWDARNNLENLQLLVSHDNESKSNTLFSAWLTDNPQSNDYFKYNYIPRKEDGTYYLFSECKEFWEERRKLLKQAIKAAFPKDFAAILTEYGLK